MCILNRDRKQFWKDIELLVMRIDVSALQRMQKHLGRTAGYVYEMLFIECYGP